MMLRTTALLLLGVLAVGCSSDNAADQPPKPAISDGPLSGAIGGEAWTFGSADFDPPNQGIVLGILFGEPGAHCGVSDLPTLNLYVPTKVGDYVVSSKTNVDFYNQRSGNVFATTGRLVVESVDDTAIRCGLYAKVDADNYVDGHFTLEPCQ